MIPRDRCLGRLTRPQARTQEAPGRSRMGVDYVERTSKSPAFAPHLPNLAINSFLVRRTAGPAWKLTFVSPESHSHCLSVRHGLPPWLVAPALLAYPAINHCNIFSSCHSHTVKNQCRIVTIPRLALSPVWVDVRANFYAKPTCKREEQAGLITIRTSIQLSYRSHKVVLFISVV